MAKNHDIVPLIDLYGPILTPKQQDFLEYYYNDDLSLSEIAENEGITRQGVCDAIKRAERELLDTEEKLGLVARLSQLSNALDTIMQTAVHLSEYNDTVLHDDTVESDIIKIKATIMKVD